jgi:hypothetical protein
MFENHISLCCIPPQSFQASNKVFAKHAYDRSSTRSWSFDLDTIALKFGICTNHYPNLHNMSNHCSMILSLRKALVKLKIILLSKNRSIKHSFNTSKRTWTYAMPILMQSSLYMNFIEYYWNSSDVGTGLYGVLCKKFRMSLLHDHYGCMVVLGSFQRQFRNNYFIFKPNYIIITS